MQGDRTPRSRGRRTSARARPPRPRSLAPRLRLPIVALLSLAQLAPLDAFAAHAALSALFSLYALPAVAQHNTSASASAAPNRPNILILLADDLGWRDVSYHDSEIDTPQIDRIAREGIELDRFYVQPTCSPTRSGLMTGKSPMRLGINRPISKNDVAGLPLEEKILPQYLADAGYQPLMVGKWHLGHYTPDLFPQARGFESFYGHVTGGIGYWDHNHGGGHDWQRDGVTLREEGYSTILIADEAIRALLARDRTRPTFLYVAFNAPHLPNEAPHDALARYASIEDVKRRAHAGMVSELDAAIGRVLDAFEDEGLLDDTIVLFSSDNGGLNRNAYPDGMKRFSDFFTNLFGRPIPFEALEFLASNIDDGASDNRPLPKGKGSVGEGGARVPAALWWPGRLEGRRYEGFMSISDVLPTLLEAIGERDAIPTDLDGRSQWSALSGDASDGGVPDYVTSGLEGMALYRAPWKLIDPEVPRLYQIYDDPTEQNDLARVHPEIVEAMVATAKAWPRGAERGESMWRFLLDPDRFGGPEDRKPWADVARERARAARE